MAKASDIIVGLQALIVVGGGDVDVDAQHDQIWAGPQLDVAEDTPSEQAAILRVAGWFFDDECDSWSRFT